MAMMETIRQNHIVKKVLMVIPFYLFTFLPLQAQTFTQRLQKTADGRGKITIHQSADIDRLVNSTILGSSGSVASKPSATPAPAPASGAASAANRTSGTSASGKSSEGETAQEEAAPRIVRGSYKTMGYRVQAFAGGNSRADRQKAEHTRDEIKLYYPNEPVYVHFYSPRWICRVGNYRTYEEAHQMLTSLRSMGFDQAIIVKGKITVTY